MEQVREKKKVAIIVHGGAYAIPDAIKEKSVDGCKLAAKKGFEILLQNGTALDAVEKAIRSLENNPVFDAGTGSVLTLAEEVEMDAIIMDGSNLNFGAVACVKTVKNPISLARAVMEKTDHCLIVGVGADFAVDFVVDLLLIVLLIVLLMLLLILLLVLLLMSLLMLLLM